MHFHHYILSQLKGELEQKIQGSGLESCFSQSKNELILVFEALAIRIGCNTPFTYLVPVEKFSRARKNVVELFPEINGQILVEIKVIPFERTMVLYFQNDWNLVVKLHGNTSNILLRSSEKVISLFNKQLEKDWEYEVIPGPYNPEPLKAPIKDDIKEIRDQLKSISPIFDKNFAERIFSLKSKFITLGLALDHVIKEANDQEFYLARKEKRVKFLLFPPRDEVFFLKVRSCSRALAIFLKLHFQYSNYRSQYNEMEKAVKKPYEKYNKIYSSYTQNISQLTAQRNPEELGHILMAHLHEVKKGIKKWTGPDFYEGGKISIKLNPELSPQENAEKYYQKHKERKKRLKYLEGELEDINRKLKEAQHLFEQFQRISSPEEIQWTENGLDPLAIKALRELKGNISFKENSDKKVLPFRKFLFEGYEIFVGKNARNNDELSFKFANKEDTWLHAKDVSGSHVIVRHQAGKPIPSTVLEFAASLAAFYSKRKTDSLVPVQYTPRKYIRKRKGDPPGMVVVQRESVLLVEPLSSKDLV